MHGGQIIVNMAKRRNLFHSNELRYWQMCGIPIAYHYITLTKEAIMNNVKSKLTIIALVAIPVAYMAIKALCALAALNTLLS